jgi:hypothetical protein
LKKNTTFRKLDLFAFSEWGETHSVEVVRNSKFDSLDVQWFLQFPRRISEY